MTMRRMATTPIIATFLIVVLSLGRRGESFVPIIRIPVQPDWNKFPVTANAFPKNNGDDDSFQEPNELLSQRIQALKETEAQQEQELLHSLSVRVQQVQSSEQTLGLLQEHSTSILELPVLCFDALLPRQSLQGTTDDPTFCRWLRDLGLGAYFVMTSLNPKTRRIRRHGVVAKIVAVDALSSKNENKDWIPTAVDFEIQGHGRCRIVGPSKDMTVRIGRWRRMYDPNGEESRLGWGDERFGDAPNELETILSDSAPNRPTNTTNTIGDLDYAGTEWSSAFVDCNLEAIDEKTEEEACDPVLLEKVHSLMLLVDEWFALASNMDTFKNLNVTASTRIQTGHPGLWVDSGKLLQRVWKELGPRPTTPTAFCFWAAALINPLPALGVSLEIRGQMLEAPTVERRLNVLERGLTRSIDNLKGARPL
jgi:hypothetical protein